MLLQLTLQRQKVQVSMPLSDCLFNTGTCVVHLIYPNISGKSYCTGVLWQEL